MCRDLEVRLIMNLGLRLGLIICRDLKILLGLLLELLEERELEMLLLALLHKQQVEYRRLKGTIRKKRIKSNVRITIKTTD